MTNTEEWVIIRDFPDYSVSSHGRVRNNRTDRILAQIRNQQGLMFVGLSRDHNQYKRAVTLLVANAYLDPPQEPFDTPIQLDGDRTNNDVDNLMWRPRWFAYLYHQQFKRPPHNRIKSRIIDTKTKEISKNSKDCVVRYGLIERDLILAIANRTYVWPTYQIFQTLEE